MSTNDNNIAENKNLKSKEIFSGETTMKTHRTTPTSINGLN